MTEDANVVINECAGILQYCQEVFEGLKAYTTEDGSIVTFRPDLNAKRMMDSARRLEMPPFPEERFLEAVDAVVRENAAWVPPYGSGATFYLRPYMFASGPVIGVNPLRNISSVSSGRRWAPTLRAAQSRSLSVSVILTGQPLMAQAM